MEYKRFGNTVILRLDVGDELFMSIKNTAIAENIGLAQISGIGASDDISVGIFDLSKHDYDRFHLTGNHEITSLSGSITTMNGEIYPHLHITCAGSDGNVVGGHLFECRISLTAEIFITAVNGTVERERNEVLEINTLKL